MFPVALTWPAVLTLPICALPVTLRLGNTPTLVATTPVSCDPLPKKYVLVTLPVVEILPAMILLVVLICPTMPLPYT